MEIGFQPIMQKVRTGIVAAGLTASTVLGGYSKEAKVPAYVYEYRFKPVTEYYQQMGPRPGFIADSVASEYTKGMKRDVYKASVKQLAKDNINIKSDQWFETMKKGVRPYEVANLEKTRDTMKKLNEMSFDLSKFSIKVNNKDLNAVDSIVLNLISKEGLTLQKTEELMKQILKAAK